MSILRYPLATEKSVGIVDRGNTITYVVDQRASKKEIKAEFEKSFNVKVKSINIINMPKNAKKAFIKLAKGYNATDVALKLKLV
ncbi:MAG: 50S ribosomal protein L23 [Candidatus Micrarchaeota archaeon]|nr:50S ribosomal protein L23 [Candidatus Micrarchaeota archaeon]